MVLESDLTHLRLWVEPSYALRHIQGRPDRISENSILKSVAMVRFPAFRSCQRAFNMPKFIDQNLCPLIPVLPHSTQRTDSDDALNQIKLWMVDCFNNHPACRSVQPVQMPRRVLKISSLQGVQKVKLHLTKGEKSPYLTLSHCWGTTSTPPLQTTKTNIGTYLHNIPLTLLPRLFLDAISLTSRLGHQYLWIDSLCIIQDSPLDWDRESSLMASVYANSTLTIAATFASSSTSSLFSTQASTSIPLEPFTLYARPATRHIHRYPDPESFPLLTRAWVYQERLLSPRVVHFTSDGELSWECNHGTRCQCGYFDRADTRYTFFADPRWGVDVKKEHAAALVKVVAAIDSKNNKRGLHARWRKITTEYSPLSLTRPDDRLPALSGLAKQMRGVMGGSAGRYLAGLWEGSFARDLLWMAVANPGDRIRGVAPSWSWASQRAGVRYTNGQRIQMGGVGVYNPAELGNWGDVGSELVGASCELVGAECVAVGGDETGRVESGWAKVRGYVVDLDPLGGSLYLENGRWVVQVNGVKSWDVFWDESPEGFEEGGGFWRERFCLLRLGCICATGEGPPYDEWSLLLRQVKEGVFERHGIVGRSRRYQGSGPEGMEEYCEHTHSTSAWFKSVKDPIIVTVI
ncbi:heterokaryon incompatibility protein-domain-containing protein [Schizothecium vesticola]|uniref:Heterokaryon incompatibility protein-domain-containing protein n=1 Tax=Schizothecium vesticola TaxID=314040 RepID=A0AA40EPC9_9PEZI|nr:heterokaryon incompatibility protein-domain-containing protein [Schizothecium vesticola]